VTGFCIPIIMAEQKKTKYLQKGTTLGILHLWKVFLILANICKQYCSIYMGMLWIVNITNIIVSMSAPMVGIPQPRRHQNSLVMWYLDPKHIPPNTFNRYAYFQLSTTPKPTWFSQTTPSLPLGPSLIARTWDTLKPFEFETPASRDNFQAEHFATSCLKLQRYVLITERTQSSSNPAVLSSKPAEPNIWCKSVYSVSWNIHSIQNGTNTKILEIFNCSDRCLLSASN